MYILKRNIFCVFVERYIGFVYLKLVSLSSTVFQVIITLHVLFFLLQAFVDQYDGKLQALSEKSEKVKELYDTMLVSYYSDESRH